ERLSGLVVIDNDKVDVKVNSGESLGIRFDATTGSVRRNADGVGSWLAVRGTGVGAALDGLRYLQATPVTRGFGTYLSDWQVDGDVAMDLQLAIPFRVAGAVP